MKKSLLALLILFFCLSSHAQEQGKIRVNGNLGLALPSSGVGITLDLIDIRYNILDNLNAGIKFGGAFMVRDMSELNATTASAVMHLSSNTMLVGDYYFHNGKSAFAPFVGIGVGSFSVFNTYMEFDINETVSYSYTEVPDATGVLGGSIRGGFELGRLRLALEYYLIPGTTMYDADNIMQSVGTSSNSYLTLNFGFVLGGGRWRR